MFEGLLQPTHLILILAIVIVIFGPGKLPDLGRELGKGIREFKQATSDITAPLDEMKGAIIAPLDDVKGAVADVKDAAALNPKASKPTAPMAATRPAEPPTNKAAQ